MFDNTHILLAYLDTRFNFIEVNSAYAEADNRSPEFFPGKNHFDLYPNSENQRIYEEVLRSGKPHNETGKAFEYVHNPERGESHWDWSLVPVKTDRGQVEGLVLALLNVTERVKAETARLESAALFRTMFESSSVGISKVSLDFVIEEINQAHCSMLGYTCDELVGMTIWDITDPVSLPEGKRMQARLRRGEIDSYQMEKKYVRKDGKAVWGLLDANLVRDSNGDPLYFLGNIVDITEKKDLELQLLQSQRLEAIGQLAGGVAHDFNNLLTVINGYSALVLDKLSDGDPKRLDIEQIATAGEKAGMLTRQLLAFSRKQVIRPTIVDLNAVVADMTTMLRRLVGENIVVRTILAEGLGKTRVDPGQMNQIIMNLAVNARDAMPTGGQITVETANFEIDREYSARHMSARHGAYCLMSISDDGIGMDEGTRSHAFEPFFTTKGVGEGTGLGLPTVYGIVKQHNGYIWLYSEPGHGTTVKVYLPQVEVNSGQPVGQCTNNGAPSGTETILLAEDDDIVRKLTASILEQSGYTVLQAADGHLALDVFGDESGRIDLLLTDVIMPGMGGKELADQLLAQSPDLRVIFVSGYTDEAISRIGILPGDVELLSKPFHPKALLTLVRTVLDREN